MSLKSSKSTNISFRTLGKLSKLQGQLLERLLVASLGKQQQGMTNILTCRWPIRSGKLNPLESWCRLECCKEHKNWTPPSPLWNRVLFTDESRLGSTRDSQSQLIWREVGTWFHPSNITEKDRYGDPGVVVLGKHYAGGLSSMFSTGAL
ncbi:hypothetical protein TNCV_2357501 [Trichonephila clavipes]|nr:hypothetical protein TNCV_2357501 [Trichonephila clavipes]